MKKKIKWEKWLDPFLSNEGDFNPLDIDRDDNEDDNDNLFKDSYQKYDEEKEKREKPVKKTNTGPVMVGPMGIIPITENNSPSKVYCFWMGHTNFDLSEPVVTILEAVPGVEALDVFSRYRFRIAIGKAFLDDKDPFGSAVLREIEKALSSSPTPSPAKTKEIEQGRVSLKDKNLNILKDGLKSKYAHWIIFSLSDGRIDYKGASTKEELDSDVVANKDSILATSWE